MMSLTSQIRSVTSAAIAGVIRSRHLFHQETPLESLAHLKDAQKRLQ
jgi:hypothetical protein